MKYRAMAVMLCMLAISIARADILKSDSPALANLEKEFDNLETDVRGTLKGIQNKGGAEYTCVDVTYQEAVHMGELFTHYKFSVAIAALIESQTDRDNANTILKIQTELAASEIKVAREHLDVVFLDHCYKYPLFVAKGTELRAIMKKADTAVQSILGRI
jgi:hypothetical protein